jgi:enoyl-CoA hydratase/carnithine racemase
MEFFLVENKNGSKIVWFNNLRKRNALNKKAYIELANILNDAAKDDAVKCVVLTGKGDFFRLIVGLWSLIRFIKIIKLLFVVLAMT